MARPQACHFSWATCHEHSSYDDTSTIYRLTHTVQFNEKPGHVWFCFIPALTILNAFARSRFAFICNHAIERRSLPESTYSHIAMKQISTLVAVLMTLLIGSAALAPVARADQQQSIKTNFDRATAPTEIVVWNRQVLGYLLSTGHYREGSATITCHSATDSVVGACQTTHVNSNSAGTSTITLRFTEINSHQFVDLTLDAYMEHGDSNGHNIRTTKYPIHAINSENDISKFLTLKLPAAELKRLPFGGKWRAELKLTEKSGYSDPQNRGRLFTATFELNVTDNKNIAIYFPSQNTATPTIDLNLKPQSGSANSGDVILAGKAELPMCLYDGYNGNSRAFRVRARSGYDFAGNGGFSLGFSAGSQYLPNDRIDYVISIRHNGTDIPLPNGTQVELTGINNTATQSMSLPKMPQPVMCVPTPITLTTANFKQAEKKAGKYDGVVRIEFSPDTGAI